MEIEDKLILIQEECGELIQACAKAQRFGIWNHHPKAGSPSNFEQIKQECIDVIAVIDMLIDWEPEDIIKKQAKVSKWYRNETN